MHDNQSTKFSCYQMWPTLFFQMCMSRRIFTFEQSKALRYRQFQLVIQIGMVLSSKLEKLSMIYVWLAQYYALRQEVVSIKCISARYLEQLLQFSTLQWVKDGFNITGMVTWIRNQESGILYFQQQQQAYISCYNWYHNMATNHSRMSIKYNYKKIDLSIVSSCE